MIAKTGAEEVFGIGFCLEDAPWTGMLGWDSLSWGYHGDNGHVYDSAGSGKSHGPRYTSGDIIGCGVNFKTKTAFFTKNGSIVGCTFKNADIMGQLYPAVSLLTGEKDTKFTVNFGPGGFKYTGS
ncbi:hypothetical protein GQ53DRAFT_46935 [Thozetella sp. PMI_491]|nr:hypothetical protein GQ53DRAFT_46935 [Thozetella sp. PMI_491]